MGFLAPWFLAGALAVGLPVFVHLLRRQTTEPRPVSSLMFFERGTQSSTRHRRLRYLLLFTLRTLTVLLLALAFARPYFKHKTVLASDKLLLVAIDDSFSMNAKDGAATKLDEAKRGALDVLSHKSAGQKAQVIELGGQMKLLTQPVEDAGELRAAVESIQPGDGHATFGELGRGMRAMAETVHTPAELDLFSDMQKSNMPGNFADMVMPGNVTLVLHRIGAQKTAPNWTVESVQAPGQLVDTKKARVIAVIAGHGTPAATRLAQLVVNGNIVATKKVDVPADGRATVVFEGLDVPYGESRCAVRIDAADKFATDDARWFAVKRADPERMLFVHRGDDTRSPLYFGAALGAAAQAAFVLQPITPEQASDIDPAKYAFVVLSDVPQIPSILEHTLERNVAAGGNVLVATGLAESHKGPIPVWGGNVEDAHYYTQAGEGYATVGDMDGSHPALKSANGWQGAKFFYAAKVNPGNARVVAKLGDGTPLVMDKQMGEGHVLLFASGLDNVANDLPLKPAFVAFVDEAAKYLSGEDRVSGARTVDSFVQLRNPVSGASAQTNAGATVDIIGPDGKRPLSLKESAAAQSFQLEHAGFYQVHFANGRDALIAVNPDPRESDLAAVPDDVLKLWTGAAATGETKGTEGASQETDNRVSGLWWWVMLLLTITALAEVVVASGYLGTQREQP
jgi:hypothetical protein